MIEPLAYLYNKYGFESSRIKQIIFGYRFVAIMTINGNIGVCATLGENIQEIDVPKLKFDLNNIKHRIILNAYYNAVFNYEPLNYKPGNILDICNFEDNKNIVMIGHFRSTVEKFKKKGIKLNIFDLEDEDISLPNKLQKEYLNKCDIAIVTATSILNNTFSNIVKECKGEVYLMGPTTIMHPYFFEYKNVKSLLGTHFKPYDKEVLNIISEGMGAKQFLKLAKKVYIIKDDSL